MKKYPGNNEYPVSYKPVKIFVISRCKEKKKSEGVAYWSGTRWICNPANEFRIGYGKVYAWEDA